MAESIDPFAGLTAVLAASTDHDPCHGTASVNVDPARAERKGVPEVVFAGSKAPATTLAAVQALLQRTASGRVLVTRASAETAALLRVSLEPSGAHLEIAPSGGTLLALRAGAGAPVPTGGVMGLLTAGTSDAPAADEAAWLAREMGCAVIRSDDVGVAGLHRLEEPLRRLREAGADAIVVAAGMDGALPSVVAGLVEVPVIGLPTSVGYGLGGGGVAALLSMLQTCAPGLAVVNIDNGIGAGATAALIANRAARARGQAPRSQLSHTSAI